HAFRHSGVRGYRSARRLTSTDELLRLRRIPQNQDPGKERSMRNIIGISAALLLATAGTASAAPFALTSTAFKAGGNIAQTNAGNVMGCTGENKSPALEWKNPPEGTKSFALL